MSKPQNILQEIVSDKREEVKNQQQQRPLSGFIKQLIPSSRSLEQALSSTKADFILECKKASPSKGLIRKNFDLSEIVGHYKKFASAISVLTDEKYFSGKLEYLQKVSALVDCPVLCKDFFIDSYQIYQARLFGADAILLMLSVLSDDDYKQLAAVAAELNLDVLTEVHDAVELQRALDLDAKIIGINNRNLKDLSINIDITRALMDLVTEQQRRTRLFISESGIEQYSEVKLLAPRVDGFLVGSSIMSKPDIAAQCRQLLYGRVKICGLTTAESAKIAYQQGATYGGLIFYVKSPRSISLEQAKNIVKQVGLCFVGVFVNHPLEQIFEFVMQLNLSHIQLHGDESEATIQAIKSRFPTIIIWKVIKVNSELAAKLRKNLAVSHADYFLLDKDAGSQFGGAGSSFNWHSIHAALDSQFISQRIILAGGINLDNAELAAMQQAFCLDINSGVESAPGIKDEIKLKQLMQTLRT